MRSVLIINLVCSLLFSWPGLAQPTPTEEVRASLNQHLWDAARNGDTAIIGEFVAAKYDLNVQDANGYTPVILAAYHGHADTLALLLKHGADPCLRDKRGNSALMGAIFKGEVRIARTLIAAPCNPDQRNNAGQTAAMYASLFQRTELLKALADKGADMQATDALGNSVTSLGQGEIRGR
ncbi:ankyrin repeat domain-containing protein [Nissabacter archeti]|uniref:ankyrin repeat domain-containing protein n=1 Tax=Nissabacter archeti TaxID=1917880 RepID=UPI0009343DD9|nr:ankyrin repeat domain-containing protein [Nissabacter archeti]